MTTVQAISPMLVRHQEGVQQVKSQAQPQAEVQPQMQSVVAFSPLLAKTILAQNKQILAPKATVQVDATEAQKRVAGYKNELKDMLTHNKSNIIAVIPRIMNAQDKDGNELIQGDEKWGTFVNAVDRLDEFSNLGFNTQHVLPIHPPGKSKAMGTAGSLYAPRLFVEKDGTLAIDPELVDENPNPQARKAIEEIYEKRTGKKLEKMDKNDVNVRFAQFAYYIDECHKRGQKVMLDLPSCASVDFAKEFPEMMAIGSDGKEKVPQGWQDIRMFKVFIDEQSRILNKPLLDMHKQYVDACIELGIDGIRADVGRAKPVEFWHVIIDYSRSKDPQFGWLAETYTHEDASPQLNMPYDRPQELLEVGFDSYYGQYHIYSDWLKAQDLYDYVKENIEMGNSIGKPKSLIGSFATHDDRSPMLYGGAPWVQFTTTLQSMLPQVNPYMTDGVQTGDYYIFPYDHALVKDTQTDNHECTVHTGRMDIFNKSRRPGGNSPEISKTVQTALALRNNEYNKVVKNGIKLNMTNAQDVITKGSFIMLPTNNPEVIAFARHKDGKTLLFVGNRNVNQKVGAKIEIPGLKPTQKFNNLMPKYGEESKFQNNQDGTITVELGASRACIFEIDTPEIQKLSDPKNVLQQKYL